MSVRISSEGIFVENGDGFVLMGFVVPSFVAIAVPTPGG